MKSSLLVLMRGALYVSLCYPLSACGTTQEDLAAPSIAANSFNASRSLSRTVKSDELLYVTDAGKSKVFMFTYPQGKLVGTLEGSFSNPAGECVDEAGNVWITNPNYEGNGFIVEYAHGGSTPIATLQETGAAPIACSVDPNTGDLAVANTNSVAIYPNAEGAPTTYTFAGFSKYYACTYDSSGNLFVDGNASGLLAELPRGGESLESVSLSENISPASMQWDGTYLGIVTFSQGNRGPRQAYQVQVGGSAGSVVSSLLLKSPGNKRLSSFQQYWISGGRIVGPDRYRHEGAGAPPVLEWKYPQGGQPIKAIGPLWTEPWGTAISPAKGKS